MVSIDTTKLEAVNTMLSLTGAGTVNSLDAALDEEVVRAIATLDRCNKELQIRGWHWNTELDQTLTEDANGRHPWQEDWISVDIKVGNHVSLDIRRQGQFIFDRKLGTNLLKTASLKVDLVRFLPWGDMPEAARNFIMTKAARMHVVEVLSDETRAGYTTQDVRQAWHVLVEAEANAGDYSIFDTGVAPAVRSRPGGTGLRGSWSPG